MRVGAPEWLVLVPALIMAAWRWPALRLHEPLRAVCLALCVLILAQLQVRTTQSGLDVWILLDRSLSAGAVEVRWPEMGKILEEARGGHDRLQLVEFADEVVVRSETSEPGFPGDRDETRTGLALQTALSKLEADRAARILVITDGGSTESIGVAGERLIRAGVPMDFRLITLADSTDYRVAEVRAPERVLVGESFLIEARIVGPDGEVPVEWARGDAEPWLGQVRVKGGRGVLRMTDRLRSAGAHEVTVRLRLPRGDGRPENDRGSVWVEAVGGPRVVVVTPFAEDPVAATLERLGFSVDRLAPRALHEGQLSGARLVVLNNVSANELRSEVLDALPFFIRRQGGGLLMAGGARSFGSGGYFGSALDEELPVSMELREDHRKLATAMAVVMDRSGSMAANVGGVTKMDLANAGAARAIELLGDSDWVAVYAVDSAAHEVVPLTEVGPVRGELIDRVRRVVSTGGGIFVYVGLSAGWKAIEPAVARQKHIVLFSDAADSEEPGTFRALLKQVRDAGATVSVIGLGTEQDPDAALLKDIANAGGGRIYFCAEPQRLPELFAQETVAVARSAFLDEPVGVQGTVGWNQLAQGRLEWLPQVDGFNLCYLRDGATAAALAQDEETSPLVAFWPRGAGRVAAVTFPLAGAHSELVRGWSGYAECLGTLARWLGAEDMPPGMSVRVKQEGGFLRVILEHDERWDERIALSGPQLYLAEGRTEREISWERIKPGQFEVSVKMGRGAVRGAVVLGETSVPFGPISGSSDPEWSFGPERIEELRAVARSSGGGERTDLASIWKAPRKAEFRSLRPWLLWALLAVFLLDAWATRWGWAPRWTGRMRMTPTGGGRS